MRLVIFDIDGTLTQTTEADEECFVRSLAEVCGFGKVDNPGSSGNILLDTLQERSLFPLRSNIYGTLCQKKKLIYCKARWTC